MNSKTDPVKEPSSLSSPRLAEPHRWAPACPRSTAASPRVPLLTRGRVGPGPGALTRRPFPCRPQNTDAALLPCISYPAFALDDEALFNQTLDKVVRKLKGKYGFKRFLRDGYRTSLEDPNRRYYKPAEIKVSRDGRTRSSVRGAEAPVREGAARAGVAPCHPLALGTLLGLGLALPHLPGETRQPSSTSPPLSTLP